MPFTFAHPAAVLWCARWHSSGAPFAAFVIGSMSPDFEYFIRLRTISVYSHELAGIFTFCLPVGLVAYAVFRVLIAPALFRNLPRYFQVRLPLHPPGGAARMRQLVGISAAIVLGAATHVLWDGFTHESGYFTRHWPVLGESIAGISVYKLLQHGSTMLGACIIFGWFHFRAQRAEAPSGSPDRHYAAVVGIATVLAFIVLHLIHPDFRPATLIVKSIDAVFVALTVAGVAFRREPA